MPGEDDVISRTFSSYLEAFQTLDPRNVAPYCAVPCVFISGPAVIVMTSAEENETLLGRMMESLEMRGYGGSEIEAIHVSQMSESLAFVSVNRTRYKRDGSRLEGLGETYTLWLDEGAWKIVAAATHDAGSLLCKCGHS